MSLDPENVAWLEQEHKNASGFVNALIADARVKYTYVLRSSISGIVKIGCSSSPLQRRNYLNFEHGESFEIVLICEGDHEKILQDVAKTYLVQGREWFIGECLPHVRAEVERLNLPLVTGELLIMEKSPILGIRVSGKTAKRFNSGKNQYAGVKRGNVTSSRFLCHLLELFDSELKNGGKK